MAFIVLLLTRYIESEAAESYSDTFYGAQTFSFASDDSLVCDAYIENTFPVGAVERGKRYLLLVDSSGLDTTVENLSTNGQFHDYTILNVKAYILVGGVKYYVNNQRPTTGSGYVSQAFIFTGEQLNDETFTFGYEFTLTVSAGSTVPDLGRYTVHLTAPLYVYFDEIGDTYAQQTVDLLNAILGQLGGDSDTAGLLTAILEKLDNLNISISGGGSSSGGSSGGSSSASDSLLGSLNKGNELVENNGLKLDESNRLQQEENAKMDKQIELVGKLNEIQAEEVKETKKISDKLSDFFGSFFENITNALLKLFIPDDDYFEDFFNRLNDFFEEKLGMLYTPIGMFIDVLQSINNAIGGQAPALHFPGVKWEECWVIEPMDFSFDDIYAEVPGLKDKVYFCTDFVMVGAILFLLQNKLREVLTN